MLKTIKADDVIGWCICEALTRNKVFVPYGYLHIFNEFLDSSLFKMNYTSKFDIYSFDKFSNKYNFFIEKRTPNGFFLNTKDHMSEKLNSYFLCTVPDKFNSIIQEAGKVTFGPIKGDTL